MALSDDSESKALLQQILDEIREDREDRKRLTRDLLQTLEELPQALADAITTAGTG